MTGWLSSRLGRPARDTESFAPEERETAVAGLSGLGPHPHRDFQTRPLDWIVERLGVVPETLIWSSNPGYERHRWDGDVDPFAKVLGALAEGRDVGVESATGTGKTFLAAAIVLWFLACFPDSIVVTAAPKRDQLLLHVWKEIGRFWPRFHRQFPSAELLTGKIRMRDAVAERESWAATAFVCGVGADEESATRAQGFHAQHMLIVTEETPGVNRAIMTAFENTRTGVHNLQLSLGNPDNQRDELHRFCGRSGTEHVRVSALDHPNVVCGKIIVPGAIGRKSVEARKADYGEQHRLYRSRVRGISPAEAADALIRREWCAEAATRYSDPAFRVGPSALGVDVANSDDGDKAAIARWMGPCLLEVSSFRCPDALQLGVRVANEMGADTRPEHVGVDAVGVGAATVNKLRELGHWVRGINAGAKAESTVDWEARSETGVSVVEEERFYNLRSQMWWYLRRDLQRGHVALPDDAELIDDLTMPSWWTRNGKIFVEPKEELRKRLGRSPDKGDAAVLGNWVRRRQPRPETDTRPISAWDPEVLAHEARECRRVRSRPPPQFDPWMLDF